MKTRLLVLAGGAALAVALAGFLFAWSGIFNVGASTGHWAITAWFLHFAMQNSVETHAMGIEAPALDDPALVLRGAGHYEQGCAPCHGTPANAPNPVVRAMTHPPPHLMDRIERWAPEELFWIVKHGVKFTAMPAWPARNRDDEVWAMTAFLLRLPELSPTEYRHLALGETARGQEIVADEALAALSDPLGPILTNCARCHGYDGSGRGEGAVPILGGQKEAYLYESLKSYAAGERFSGMMQLAASGMNDASMAALARHYATAGRTGSSVVGRADDTEETVVALPGEVDAAPIQEGEAIAQLGVPAAGIPPCASCHGPASTPRHPQYPVLAGQIPGYLSLQLNLFRHGARGGTAYAHIMQTIAKRLSDRQIEAVSQYYGGLARESLARPAARDTAPDSP
jgi:cytochrome c553